jgi:hypothetical protein
MAGVQRGAGDAGERNAGISIGSGYLKIGIQNKDIIQT